MQLQKQSSNKKDLQKGHIYSVKLHDGSWTNAEFLDHQISPGGLRDRHRYHFRNLSSGREIFIRSLQKVRAAMIPAGHVALSNGRSVWKKEVAQ